MALQNSTDRAADSQASERFPPGLNSIIWLAVSFLLAVAIARVAVWLQLAGFSPLVLFPLLVGALVGAAIGFLAIYFGHVGRKSIVAVAILAAAVTVAAEHGCFYLDYCKNFHAKLQSDPKTQLAAAMNPDSFEPASFTRYMAAQAAESWPLWIADAVAMIGAASVAAWFNVFHPRSRPQSNYRRGRDSTDS